MMFKRIGTLGMLSLSLLMIVVGIGVTPDRLKSILTADEIATMTDQVTNGIQAARTGLVIGGLTLAALTVLLYRRGRRILDAIQRGFQMGNEVLETMPGRHAAFDLFLISLLGLFFETLIIRWLSTEVRLFAYYKNLPLIASFMGLGIGFMLARRKVTLLPVFSIAFCALSGIVLLGAANGVFLSLSNAAGSDVILWGFLKRSALPSFLTFYVMVPLFFLATVLVFIPLGQATGQAMLPFTPIRAYTLNVLGSLVGVWLFSALSYLAWPPFAWFGIGLALYLLLLRRTRRALLINSAVAIGFMALAISLRGDSYWSPYYRIDVKPIDARTAAGDSVRWGYTLDVNYDFHQTAANLAPEFVQHYGDLFPELRPQAVGYALPYEMFRPRNVLIVGAGSGNDAATARRWGVQSIEAVDIDPTIIDIGKRIHPEAPYGSPNVTLIVDDARSYFKKTQNQYDLIVFSLLDSHTLFSNMSSLRLDNFVYTVEGIQAARQHLAENGVLALYFLSGNDWSAQRLFNIVTAAFGSEPAMLQTGHGMLFLIGPGFKPEVLQRLPDDPSLFQIIQVHFDETIGVSVDDWPFLYLRERGIPGVYWQVLALLAVLSIGVIAFVTPGNLHVNWHFFLLGAAFLLLEIKSITDLALLFGSTWIVNSIVITAILIMVLAANIYVQRFQLLDRRIYYGLLAASLLLGYFLPLDQLLGQNLVLRAVLGSLVTSLPLFFAGIIFSTSLKKAESVDVAFGSNLLGSVVGGLLEYSSLAFGLRSLMLVALALYAGSFIARGRGQ